MSDYLTNLASRALGASPVIHPSTPSRFSRGPDVFQEYVKSESQDSGSPFEMNEISTIDEKAATRPQNANENETEDIVAAKKGQLELESHVPESNKKDDMTRRSPIAKESIATPIVNSHRFEMTNENSPLQVDYASPTVLNSVSGKFEDVRTPVNRDSELPDRQSPGQFSVKKPDAKAEQIFGDRFHRKGNIDEVRMTPQILDIFDQPFVYPTATPVNRKSFFGERVGTDRTGNDHQKALDSSSQQPTIRITIGKVEVRAMTPQNEQQPRRRSPVYKPRLSLDEYLKRSNEGRS